MSKEKNLYHNFYKLYSLTSDTIYPDDDTCIPSVISVIHTIERFRWSGVSPLSFEILEYTCGPVTVKTRPLARYVIEEFVAKYSKELDRNY